MEHRDGLGAGLTWLLVTGEVGLTFSAAKAAWSSQVRSQPSRKCDTAMVAMVGSTPGKIYGKEYRRIRRLLHVRSICYLIVTI